MELRIDTILGIKEECIQGMIKGINEQIGLISSAKAGEMEFDEFKEKFNKIEDEKIVLRELKDDCNLILSTFANL